MLAWTPDRWPPCVTLMITVVGAWRIDCRVRQPFGTPWRYALPLRARILAQVGRGGFSILNALGRNPCLMAAHVAGFASLQRTDKKLLNDIEDLRSLRLGQGRGGRKVSK